MTIKITGKDWTCNNQCRGNCCSEIFLPLPPAYKTSFLEKGFYIANNNYSDYRWLEFHKVIIMEKMPSGDRKISLKEGTEYKIIFNPFKGYDELYVKDVCMMLRQDLKCKVFRARPDICKKSRCIVFDNSLEIQFYAENGLLKEKIEAYRKGELKQGDKVEFHARVKEYVKGYVNYRDDIDESEIDYKLSHPTKIRKYENIQIQALSE